MKRKSLIFLLACTFSVIGGMYISSGSCANAAVKTAIQDENATTGAAVKVGAILKEPEEGWNRFDDKDREIKYDKYGYELEDENCYDGSYHSISLDEGQESTIKFRFYGSKIRLYSMRSDCMTENSEISFDGGKTFEKCSAYKEGLYESNEQTMFYEKTDLEEGIHDVVIRVSESGREFYLDAIDIDKNGYLISDITDVEEPEII